jgi:hypothetical protein
MEEIMHKSNPSAISASEMFCFVGYGIQQMKKLASVGRKSGSDREIQNEVFNLANELSIHTSYTKNETKVVRDDCEPESIKSNCGFAIDNFANCSKIAYEKQCFGGDCTFFSFLNQGGLQRPADSVHQYGYEILKMVNRHMFTEFLHADSLINAISIIKSSRKLSTIWDETVQNVSPGILKEASRLAKSIMIKKIVHSRGNVYIQQYYEKKMEKQKLTSGQTIRTNLKAFETAAESNMKRKKTETSPIEKPTQLRKKRSSTQSTTQQE